MTRTSKHLPLQLFCSTLLLAAIFCASAPAEAQNLDGDKWSSSSRTFYINQEMPFSYRNAVRDSDDPWNNAGADFSYSYGGLTDNYPLINNDPTSVVDLDYTPNPDALATTIERSSGGYYTDGDIIIDYRDWLNDVFHASSSTSVPYNKYDLRSAVIHEFGHMLGLAHDSDYYAVMYDGLSSGVVKRALTGNDKDGILYIYGSR